LVRALLDSQAQVVTLVAKSHTGHVERALRTTLAENLEMIRDTVSFLRAEGRRVFLDAEHFFDGYATDRDYALEAVRVAAESGAEVIALCDTNGGMLPDQVAEIVRDVVVSTGARIGIHCHNDTGCAVANSMAAVEAGATHVQGTVNGYGERTGNADLLTVVANLQLKKGFELLEPHRLQESTRIAHAIAEVTNVPAYSRQPYVGSSAFAHKAGLHASAIKVDPDLYQHMDPKHVGNDMRMLVSDMAGRASIELKSRELGFDLDPTPRWMPPPSPGCFARSRTRSCAATPSTRPTPPSSCCCAVRSTAPCPSSSTVESWRVITDARGEDDALSEATVKLSAAGERVVQTGEGNGPVNALDHALRSALAAAYPEIGHLELIDYKVRILDAAHGTDAVTRVLIETSDGTTSWMTIGVAANILEASWDALVESVTYGLVRAGVAPR
jgi:2-isopropylmalate synthase